MIHISFIFCVRHDGMARRVSVRSQLLHTPYTLWDTLNLYQTLGNNIFLHPMFIFMNLTYDFSVFEGLEL